MDQLNFQPYRITSYIYNQLVHFNFCSFWWRRALIYLFSLCLYLPHSFNCWCICVCVCMCLCVSQCFFNSQIDSVWLTRCLTFFFLFVFVADNFTHNMAYGSYDSDCFSKHIINWIGSTMLPINLQEWNKSKLNLSFITQHQYQQAIYWWAIEFLSFRRKKISKHM